MSMYGHHKEVVSYPRCIMQEMVELHCLQWLEALKCPLPWLTTTKLTWLVLDQNKAPVQVHGYQTYLNMIYNVSRKVWYPWTWTGSLVWSRMNLISFVLVNHGNGNYESWGGCKWHNSTISCHIHLV